MAPRTRPPSKGPARTPADGDALWRRVTHSVTPLAPRRMEIVPLPEVDTAPSKQPRAAARPVAPAPPPPARGHAAPSDLEPRRHRRLSRERDPIEARLDLHGLGRFAAQDAVTAFLAQAQARGLRAVLVITGHGRRYGCGEGVIRASLPEWLHGLPLRGVVAAYAPAHRRHGGEGAWYITLKQRT